ncbi:ribonuclease P protein component [Mariniphaga sediminis]|uniref:ribonuclease P protein component n=1 Tax=Mariniphaga sediminis TaxID=1628158 RepID=UPI00356463AA
MEKTLPTFDIQNRRFTLKKDERLRSKIIINKLFSEGESFLSYPLKIVYLNTKLPVKNKVQVGFSVSKKSFKNAVKRNLLKRRMKEAYRLNKHILLETGADTQWAIFIIFIGKEILDYKSIEQSMKKALLRCTKITLTEK